MSAIIIDNAEDRSFSVLTDGILRTLRDFPLRSMPSSINAFTFMNIVSGKIDQNQRLVMWRSPERCASAISFGRVLVRRCSANTI